jgi:hypothetical protein
VNLPNVTKSIEHKEQAWLLPSTSIDWPVDISSVPKKDMITFQICCFFVANSRGSASPAQISLKSHE